MRIASLGSGSRGNGTLVADGTSMVLIDLGFSVRESEMRLARLGVEPTAIDAIMVTHEHADHIGGVAAFATRFGIPVHMSSGTYFSGFERHDHEGGGYGIHRFDSHRPFDIAGLSVTPVPVPHDAREPCQFVISNGRHRVGVLTDIGHITPHVTDQYSCLDVLLLECNYDPGMLREGPYPWRLKQRVGGIYGHLGNDQAAALVDSLDLSQLQHLVLSHISEKNNLPGLARSCIGGAVGHWHGDLLVADQDLGFDWIELKQP
jgi:phosphoribosyl 1,2-cyclic phosphodiesterase